MMGILIMLFEVLKRLDLEHALLFELLQKLTILYYIVPRD